MTRMPPARHNVQVRLLYVSRTTGPQTTTVTRAILEKAQAHNQTQGITGVLCQGQGFFIQILEGERSAINRLYLRIAADSRHKDVVLLQQLRILCLGPDVITPVQAVVAKQVRRSQVPNAPVSSHVTGPRVRAEEEKRRWL